MLRELADEQLSRYEIKLATTCNKKVQQQESKNNAWIVDQMDEDDLEDLWIDLDEAETGLSRANWWRILIMDGIEWGIRLARM